MNDAPTASPDTPCQPERARWLAVLARADPQALDALASGPLAEYRHTVLRAPETGLVMVRARIGNSGDRFNLGEATVTRCAVQHRDDSGRVYAGVGHVLGSDARHAEQLARLDALLQRADLHELLQRTIVQPLAQADAARRRDRRAAAEATRVRFFTLQAELA